MPIVVFGLYGGAIADAVDRRVLYLWSSLGTWAVTLALLAQTLLDVGNVWLILALVAVQSGLVRDRLLGPRRDHPADRRRRTRARPRTR